MRIKLVFALCLVLIGGLVIWTWTGKDSTPLEKVSEPPVIAQQSALKDAPVRQVIDNQDQTALQLLKLWEPSDQISWATRDGDAGNYVYQDVFYAEESLKIETLTLTGVHLSLIHI